MSKDIATAYHNLSVMLDAGMPILKSLNITTQGLSGGLKKIFSALTKSVSQGNTIPEAIAKYPMVFAPLDLMLIEAADISGNLPQSFNMLSQWYDFCNKIKMTILSGLMFPFAVLNIAALIGPLPTLFLAKISIAGYLTTVIQILALFYIPAAVILVIFRYMPKAVIFRRGLDIITLKIPLLGQAVYHIAITRYCWAFHMLYKAGVPIIQCAQKSPAITGNSVVAALFEGAAQSAKNGNPVYEGFSRQLPPEFLNLWKIGEETGKLEDVTKRLGDNAADTAQHLFEEFAKWLPKIIYFAVAAFIVFQILKGAAILSAVIPQI
jgi:type IV pilus assembly protein PilC